MPDRAGELAAEAKTQRVLGTVMGAGFRGLGLGHLGFRV